MSLKEWVYAHGAGDLTAIVRGMPTADLIESLTLFAGEMVIASLVPRAFPDGSRGYVPLIRAAHDAAASELARRIDGVKPE
jgi:hypothetical protein